MDKNGIRVAHVIGKMMSGGVESVVFNYYTQIDKNKYQFDFFYDDDSVVAEPESIKALGARFYKIPRYQNLFKHIQALIYYFKKNQYQIVHVHMNTLSLFALFAAKASGVPIRILHNHSTASPGEFKRNLFKYALRPFAPLFATHKCACSKLAANWMYGTTADVAIFNNAIEIEKFLFNAHTRNATRQELGIENSFVIGHVGRFCSQKNHAFLIDLFKRYHQKHTDSVLLLAGTGELQSKIQRKVNELGLTGHVKFLGIRNDVHRLYQAMDCFILPSLYEGLPVVGIEAQASGVKCLFSNAITDEARLLPQTAMLSLKAPMEHWINEIEKTDVHARTAIDIQPLLDKYLITKEAMRLQNYYDAILSAHEHHG